MKDGLIDIDSKAAEDLGFTREHFDECSYMWKVKQE